MLAGAEKVADEHLPGAGKVNTAAGAPHHSNHAAQLYLMPLPKLSKRRF